MRVSTTSGTSSTTRRVAWSSILSSSPPAPARRSSHRRPSSSRAGKGDRLAPQAQRQEADFRRQREERGGSVPQEGSARAMRSDRKPHTGHSLAEHDRDGQLIHLDVLGPGLLVPRKRHEAVRIDLPLLAKVRARGVRLQQEACGPRTDVSARVTRRRRGRARSRGRASPNRPTDAEARAHPARRRGPGHGLRRQEAKREQVAASRTSDAILRLAAGEREPLPHPRQNVRSHRAAVGKTLSGVISGHRRTGRRSCAPPPKLGRAAVAWL